MNEITNDKEGWFFGTFNPVLSMEVLVPNTVKKSQWEDTLDKDQRRKGEVAESEIESAQRDVVKFMSRDGHSINYTVNENDSCTTVKLTQLLRLLFLQNEWTVKNVVTDETKKEEDSIKVDQNLFHSFRIL